MMLKLLAVVALLVAVASGRTLRKQMFNGPPFVVRLNGKIINGDVTTIEQNPHQISIRYNEGHYCGGSIISKYWVLTAAHCLDGILDHYTILAGTADRLNENSSGSIHTVDGIINHPHFSVNIYGNHINDVALIHVLEPFKFDETRQPIELFDKYEETPVGSVSIITGWGNNGHNNPQFLNLVEVPIISKSHCDKQYGHRGGILDGQICAAYNKGGKDACQGDSGGPLSVEGRLAGIVSWGEGCARPGRPGVYTEVAYFRDWIKSVVNI